MADENMDVAAVRELLGTAVARQVGSLVTLTLLAGSVRGVAGAGLKETLQSYAVAEVTDTQLLVEKLTALGGDVPAIELPAAPAGDLAAALPAFLDREDEVLAALHKVIEPSGQEPASEALEHLMEHVIMRKQRQVDFLRVALS